MCIFLSSGDNLRPNAPRLPTLIMKFRYSENDGVPVGMVSSDLTYLDMVVAGHARTLEEGWRLDKFLFA